MKIGNNRGPNMEAWGNSEEKAEDSEKQSGSLINWK